jgi:hypothetical protein
VTRWRTRWDWASGILDHHDSPNTTAESLALACERAERGAGRAGAGSAYVGGKPMAESAIDTRS